MRAAEPSRRDAAKPTALRVGDLVGTRVLNPQGQLLGQLEDVVVDLELGSVAYAVVSLAGAGGRRFAIPWQAVEVDPAQGRILLAIGEEALRKAPSFAAGSWPDFGDRRWGTRIHAFYNQDVYWT